MVNIALALTLLRKALVDLGQVQPARLAVVGGERGVSRPLVALAAESVLQQVQALLCAADPEGNYSGFTAGASVGELRADQSRQFGESAQILLEGLQPRRELDHLRIPSLGPERENEEV